MSAEKLSASANNRAHTPARFISLTAGDGPVVINVIFIKMVCPVVGTNGGSKARVILTDGVEYYVKEETRVIAQILSADGLHGTSR
jgi:hypothetical protein